MTKDTMKKKDVIAGIETGGTKILCRVVDGEGVILTDVRFATGTPERSVPVIVSSIRECLLPRHRLRAVGVASFGPICLDQAMPSYGQILATPKPNWTGFNLHRALVESLHARVVLDTDVNAAAFAEQQMGAARGLSAVAYITVGTGIGCGLVVDGRTLKGALHPEAGHVRLRRQPGDLQPSTCRFHDDCAEGLIAGPAIRRRLGDVPELAGSTKVQRLFVDYLAQLCETLVLTWSPQRIVVGGGVMNTAGLLGATQIRLREIMANYGPSFLVEAPGYLSAAALPNAGLTGALLMAKNLVWSKERASAGTQFDYRSLQ